MANRAALIRQENLGRTVTRRGRRFIEFDLGGGVTRFVATLDPLHVRGSATEIDTAFVSDTGAWQWKLAQADFQVHARSVFNAGNLVEWRHESGEWIIVDPQSINWINQDLSRQQIAIKQAVTGISNDYTLSFPAGYGAGRHFSYTAHPSRLIKHITIDSLANLPTPSVTGPSIWFEAEWTLSTSTGVDLWLDGVKWEKTNGVRVKTANRIEFRNTANTQVLWYADAPVATDANGEAVICEYEVRRSGGPTALFITVRVPRAWLLTATYPVAIDPTLTTQPDATAGIDSFTRENDPTSPTPTNISWSTNPAATNRRFNLAKFTDVDTIPDGSTVTAATLSIWNTSVGSRSFTLNSILAANSGWVEGLTWNYAAPSTIRWAGDTGSDGGTDAGCSVSGTDWNASALATFSTAGEAAGTEYPISLDITQVQAWVDGGNYGILQRRTDAANVNFDFRSSDHTTAAERPELVIDYTAAGGTTITPPEAVAAFSAIAPAVLKGSLSIAPANAAAVTGAIAPAVMLGSLAIAPAFAGMVGTAIAPTVIKGSLSIAPPNAEAVMSTNDPVKVLGSLSMAPAFAGAALTAIAPTVVIGAPPVAGSGGRKWRLRLQPRIHM